MTEAPRRRLRWNPNATPLGAHFGWRARIIWTIHHLTIIRQHKLLPHTYWIWFWTDGDGQELEASSGET